MRRAHVGDFIFFSEPHFDIESGEVKRRRVHTLIVENEQVETEGVISENRLNSLGRFVKRVWVEKEMANHEIRYMKKNSIRKTFI